MKKLMITLFAFFFSFSAWSYTLINCDGITMSNSNLLLAIDNEQLLQVRIQATAGSHPRALITNLVSKNQNSSLYSIAGSPEIMEIENSVLRLDGGFLRIGEQRFTCDSN